jgi:hypothetical protein
MEPGARAHTRLRDGVCCDPHYYIYWVSARTRSHRLEQRSVPASMRPLIREFERADRRADDVLR